MSLTDSARRVPRPVAETLSSINFDKAIAAQRGHVTNLSWHRGNICIGSGELLALNGSLQLSYKFRPLAGDVSFTGGG